MSLETRPPLVLDLDQSVGPMPGERRFDLREQQEALRFGCSLRMMRRLQRDLDLSLPQPADHGPVLLGSGDFHHLSWPLIARTVAGCAENSVRVLVLDNHPDNMRFPWGVHCGSWVRRVAMMPEVSHVHVAGITSGDIGLGHSWENYLLPLYAGKLSYWSVGVNTSWARWLGLSPAFRHFSHLQDLVYALCGHLQAQPQATYVSIDKDVFAPEVVQTNWDQGQLQLAQAQHIIQALQGQLIGSDITGDVSSYRYQTAWKRWLSAQDGQLLHFSPDSLVAWQVAQHPVNLDLCLRLERARVAGP